MVDRKRLKLAMLVADTTVPDLCKKASFARNTFYAKLSGKSEFTLGEVERISDALKLSDEVMLDIFFAKKLRDA